MPQRCYALDWLRIIAVIVVFFFHAAHIFDLDPEASIKNRDTSVTLSVYAFFADQWMMHVIFLVAGASAWSSLRTRTRSSFLRERVSRLLVPFLLGTIVLIPWHGYVSAENHQTFSGSYGAFLPVHFAGIGEALRTPPLPWNSTVFFVTSWHLWFLGDLFVLSALTALCERAASTHLEPWFKRAVKGLGTLRIAALGLPIILIKLVLDARFSSHTDWSETLVWLLLYAYGWLFMSESALWRDVESQASGWLGVGVVCCGLLGLTFREGLLMHWLEHPSYTWDYLLYQVLAGVNTWAWIVAITGLCLRYLNREHPHLGYLGAASLPFYILHQTALLTLGFWVVQTNWTVGSKFLVITSGAFASTAAIYELLIRRTVILRIAFGMRSN